MGKSSSLAAAANKLLSTALAAALLLTGPGGIAFAAPIARVNIGQTALGTVIAPAATALGQSQAATVGSMQMTFSPGLSASTLIVAQEAVIGSAAKATPSAQRPTAVLPTASAAPIQAEALPAGLSAVDRHPVIGIVNEIQRVGGQKLLNEFTGARSAQDLGAVAAALPAGAAKSNLTAFAQRLALPDGGGARLSEVFDGGAAKTDRSALPAQEAAKTSGFYHWLATARLPRPIAGLRRWAAAKAEAARPKVEKMDTERFRLKGSDVRWSPNPNYLPKKATEAKLRKKGVVGQDAALDAMRFGMELWEKGYNLIVSGPDGTGRETAVRQLLSEIAPKRATPNDLVAVTHLDNPENPVVLEMAPGEGREFKAGVEAVLENVGGSLEKVFSTGQYAQMKKKLLGSLQAAVADRQKAIERKAAKVKIKGEWGLRISVRQMSENQFGIMAEVTYQGEPLKAEEIDEKIEGKPYSKEDLMAELKAASKPLIEEYGKIMKVNMEEQAKVTAKLQQVEVQLAGQVISQLAGPVYQLASGAPSHEDQAHHDWRARQQAYWAEFEAKVAAAEIGPLRIAFTQQGQIVMVYGEKTIVTPKVFEELKAKGVIGAGETFESFVQRALAVAKPLLAEQEAIAEKISAEHAKIHENDPPLSESRKQAVAWLETFVEHLVKNYPAFVSNDSPKNPMAGDPQDSVKVSLLTDNANTQGAPVVFEKSPNFSNLFGEAEGGSQMVIMPGLAMPVKRKSPGGPVLKSGSFLKARGGYLVLDLLETLREGTYPFLMRMVRSGQATITEGGVQGIATGQGEQYKVDVKGENMVKIVFIASPMMHMMVEHNDEDFSGLFRAAAEFERSFKIAKETIQAFLSFLHTQIQYSGGKLLDMSQSAIAGVLEESAKMAGSNRKLTAQFGAVNSLLLEASHYARKASRDIVEAEDVRQAVDARSARRGSSRKHMLDLFGEGTFHVDIEGEVQGQNNGLAVVGHDFGVPSRITYEAGVRTGGRLIVSTDQDAHSTGSSFDKSVGVIQGFLKRTFGSRQAIPAEVSIEFAQQYGGIDGDSATQTMTYGVLSAYSGAKIKQGIAMTGSMDQKGNVQVIGGVNEKITGFYDVVVDMLRRQGKELNGEQGVLIPEMNVADLMLRPDIKQAVDEGKFKIWAISHVSQGVEILMDKPYSEVIRDANKYFAQIRSEAAKAGK
ncbi:MAG: hypothetical protein CO113_16320 [Elusimicrobia bacterium CG_4_9_14_3_um_filter_62_55]|nr:MAG: hypothetical protein COR54_18545 [Elusimicrobia bacterium CG22_combo_CG10-13_8_21_14_all_63_91]PJA18034.1 MAG: hypothetical protein COX66_02410 [Elusimicrobia bacterium CG_4_10_14_0_2_um_filter_63_34]PJB23890.1 MAG: hypothetical protein CO113_16320 [Elusimicrobia bacterium CG_4_9_14_3_um_filter_62_55]